MNIDEIKDTKEDIDLNNINTIDYSIILEELKLSYEKEKDQLEATIRDQKKNIIHLRNDIENVRRNSLTDIQTAVNTQCIKIIDPFLRVFDDYQRSIEYLEKSNHPDILSGLMITFHSFLKAFKDLGVIEINTDNGFDPQVQEAISIIPTDDENKYNTIAQVVQKGFMYKDQLLRPAKVIIFSKE